MLGFLPQTLTLPCSVATSLPWQSPWPLPRPRTLVLLVAVAGFSVADFYLHSSRVSSLPQMPKYWEI